MSWITPKTNWIVADGVDFNDLNRIEGNIAFIATNPSGLILQLAPDGGNVGIGIVSPTSKLHVDKDLSLKGTSDADSNIEFASDADLLWDESEDEFVFNKGVRITGSLKGVPDFGDIGTLITAGSNGWTIGIHLAGTTVLGSTLVYSAVFNSTDGSSLSSSSNGSATTSTLITGTPTSFGFTGTWRLLSRVYQGTNGIPVGLFQRIS